ncbi:MAG: fibrobacter succinogenes major paralogous domain-containing protein, partial [Candidatus Marinimicrobia bacterium]|nr:fibrobacter succinogenes major paralogous domain-containing protein [Candidatus Neomarinimicrobiota bacterium]
MKSNLLTNQITIFLILLLFIAGCKKEVELPVVTTEHVEATTIFIKSAVGKGSVVDDGGGTVIERGACWSTIENPTVDDNRFVNGNGLGSFDIYMEGLSANTLYHLRAYAKNQAGIGYGNQILFTTLPPTLPILTTTSVNAITQTTAVSGGKWIDDNGDEITAKGVCWSTTSDPTINDNKTENGTGAGEFISSLTGLLSGTTYYLRAYAINNEGIGYGNELIFTTLMPVTDIDGNNYTGVTIGSQVWMVENLKTTRYRNGDLIGTTILATLNISTENTPKYQWAYGGNEDNVATYGRLYTWYAVTDSRNICPTGWIVPADTDWTIL